MPASRSARAMIFAPRSCPSSPGFAINTRIFRSLIFRSLSRGARRRIVSAELREDHEVVIAAFAEEVAAQAALLHEAERFQNMLRAVVVIEHVDAKLAEVHVVEGEADESLDGIAAEAAVPRRRLTDEKAEPGSLRDPIDVVNRGIADVRSIVAPLDGEVTLDVARVHGALKPLDLILERD